MSLLKKAFTTEAQRHGDNYFEKSANTNEFIDFNFKTVGYYNKHFVFSSVSPCLRGSIVVFLFFVVLIAASAELAAAAAWKCAPTPQDEIGPFYRPNAPLRSKIGSGYILEGTVRSAATCQAIPGARIEFWQVGPDGNYSDAYRATIITDRQGRYRLTTSYPPPYARRQSHIHILVDMRGYAGLITQHYPKSGKRRATFNLVMETE